MYTIFAILIVIASILLVGVILIQKSKGGGLAANVNNYNQFMGVRKTTDFVEKATWGLAIAMVVLSVAAAYLVPVQRSNGSVLENAPVQTTAPALPNPTQKADAAAPAAAAPAAKAPAAEAPAAAN